MALSTIANNVSINNYIDLVDFNLADFNVLSAVDMLICTNNSKFFILRLVIGGKAFLIDHLIKV